MKYTSKKNKYLQEKKEIIKVTTKFFLYSFGKNASILKVIKYFL